MYIVSDSFFVSEQLCDAFPEGADIFTIGLIQDGSMTSDRAVLCLTWRRLAFTSCIRYETLWGQGGWTLF